MLVATLLAVTAVAGPAVAFDEQRYAQVLERHTRAVADAAGTRVDYAGLRSSPDWRHVVASLADSDPESLGTREARLALWINAYNVLAIDVVLGGYPLESIRDRGNLFRPVWKLPAGRVGSRTVTLDEIEHEILRPMGDPRIHAAIVCASTSCPSLRREPFVAARVDRQLDDAMRGFLAEPRKGMRLDRAARRVWLSSIFDWFAEDFGGDDALVAYVARYAPPDAQAWLATHAADLRVEFFDYDWGLNDLRRAP